jgi:flagellar motor switch protein FliN/FliY
LSEGSVVEFERLAGESIDVCVNNTIIAKGEVVVVNERYGIRLTQVLDAADRIRKI